MKNKLLILNIISYVILYHLISEFIYYSFLEKGSLGTTPLGFIIFKFNRLKYDYPFLLLIVISFIINMVISGILLGYIYKWKDKIPPEKLFGKLFFVFIIVSILLLLLLILTMYLTDDPGIPIFIFYYFPMPIMAVIMVPLFKFNQWLVEHFWSK